MTLGGEWNLPATTLSIGTEYWGSQLFSHGVSGPF
jgi:hypothetical protein